MGPTGCGKSTLVKHINGLLLPTFGDVFVNGMNTKDIKNYPEIPKTVGFMFQNPNDQIIASNVEEEIAFGLENLRMPPENISKKIKEVLPQVNLTGFESRSTSSLSGGEKQRLTLASILAMEPNILVLDEATSMLDPQERKNLMNLVEDLNKNKNITVILITHNLSEAIRAKKILVIDNGETKKIDTPNNIFTDLDLLKSSNIFPLESTLLLDFIKTHGYNVNLHNSATADDCANEILKVMVKNK